jgi:signal transduction histidine kinase
MQEHRSSAELTMQKTTKALRKTGLEVLGDRPWGTHFCVFYEMDEDLLELLVPYFKAGIENNELCFWVLADSLTEQDAWRSLNRGIPDLNNQSLARNIEFLRSEDCYLKEGVFDLQRVTDEWGERLNSALARGYDGIRVSGYAGWPQTRGWPNFWRYEDSLNASIADQPMMVLCTYPLTGSNGSDILDVAHTHQCAVSRRSGNWDVIETAALKEAKEKIEELNQELEQRVIDRTRELSLAQAELARMTRLTTTGQLAASITHEIAQPIGAMVTSADACLRWLTNSPADVEHARISVRRVIKDGHRAQEVFTSIRSMVQRAEPRMGALEINDVIADGLELVAAALQQQHVVLKTDLEPSLPRLRGDRVQLQQVLLNVVNNAIQAMSNVNDRPRMLTIRSGVRPEGVLVEAQDTGIGLDPSSIDQIFESLFTTKSEGMGIGLAIAKSIVAAHHGRIWAEPGESCGAIFRILLPIDGSSERLREASV